MSKTVKRTKTDPTIEVCYDTTGLTTVTSAVNATNTVSTYSSSWNDYSISADLYGGALYNNDSDILCNMMSVMTEEEILGIVDRIRKTTLIDNETEKSTVMRIISLRHFSEKALLEMIGDVSSIAKKKTYVDKLMEKHRSDILSGNYPTLSLALEMSKD